MHYASNLSILRNYPLKERLQSALNIPVFINNDANLAGFAEQQAGAAKNAGSCLYVTLSTGIGGAFITQHGEIFTGSHGMACDIGHTSVTPAGPVCSCGQRGCWEAVASGTAIAKNASARFNTPCTTADVFTHAANGHKEAQKLLNEAAIYSGMALANGAKLFDADTVVMGGSVSLSQTEFINAIRQHFQTFMSNFRIIPLHTAALGPHTGVIGAGLYAQRHTQP